MEALAAYALWAVIASAFVGAWWTSRPAPQPPLDDEAKRVTAGLPAGDEGSISDDLKQLINECGGL